METTLIKQVANIFELGEVWILISIGALYVYKTYKTKHDDKKQRRIDTLTNIKEYFDLPNNKRETFIKELLLENHFSRLISWKDFSFFASSSEPIRFLKMYLICAKYMLLNRTNRTIHLKADIKPKLIYRINMVAYYLSGVPSLLMLLSAHIAFSNSGPEIYAPWTIVTLSLISLSAIFLSNAQSIQTAETLVKDLNSQVARF